ncbi:hypothetical protein [Yeosuana sp. AK3]
MNINKLHIFSKNTDATASLRGYHYQVLKTVKTWIENYSLDIDDNIYCDFEEDIFQLNEDSKTAKFRQIKLYSRNFSFSSEEIQKCIAHFFMLHVKTDYKSLEKEFVFEANTSVAQNREGNDAELLRNWNEHQDNLSEDLARQCALKVKEIVSYYIEKQAKAIDEDGKDVFVQEALSIFKSLEESDWVDFIKQIKWEFKDVKVDEEFVQLRTSIEELILELPFHIDKDDLPSIFGEVHTFVWDKATQSDIADKKLTSEELNQLLLKSSNDADRWYWEVYNRWKDVDDIERVVIGEFYEAIDGTRHCRITKHFSKHKEQWLKIMELYIAKEGIDDDVKRTAVYEYLWLLFRPLDISEIPEGNLKGKEDYFRFYFEDFDSFKTGKELEDAQSLMNIAVAAGFMDKTNLKGPEVQGWFDKMRDTLNSRIEIEQNHNEVCYLLENLGTHYLFLNANRETQDKKVQEVLEPLEKILKNIDKAEYYNVSQLSSRLNDYVELLLETDAEGNSDLIDAVIEFTERLNPIVEVRSGKFRSAKDDLNRGIKYLNSDIPKLSLKALDSFHKAKNKFNNQESFEGYVLALINIAQLYSGIGMNLAAKYYALGAAWVSIHKGDRKLLKRIADAFGVVFHADFKQGSWMNAIVSFTDYMSARNEFKGTPLNPELEEMPFKIMADLALMFHLLPKIAPELKVMIGHQINNLGVLGEEFIKPSIKIFEESHPTYQTLIPVIERELTDVPLNDLGKIRKVNFNALGIEWTLSFDNTYEMTPQSEEFCGIAQIILAEIALSKYDFHLIRGKVEIQLETSIDFRGPSQEPSNESIIWKAWVRQLDSQNSMEINLNTSSCITAIRSIVSNLSLLPYEEFDKLFDTLYKESDLAGKTQIQGLYQRMYRYVFKQPNFDALQRKIFEAVSITNIDLPKTNKVMEWENKLSSLYSQEVSLKQIDYRFESLNKNIYLTIGELVENPEFVALLKSLRNEGWQDWHIFLAINNFILTQKTQFKLREISNPTQEDFNRIYFELKKLDEAEFKAEFPVGAFQSLDFQFTLKNTMILILESFGLANPSKYPNFDAIREFLDVRFNMAEDGSGDKNPFKDIK